MKIYGYVEKGMGKIECQDRVVIGDTILAGGFLTFDSEELPNLLVAVADGVGGYAGGEKASLLVADSIRVLNRRTNLVESDVRSFIEFTNEQIKRTAQSNPDLEKMATTLTALVMNQEKALSIHIGNCRLCTYKKYLQPITKDQTVVAEMVSRGELTREEAKRSPLRNQISACFGGGSDEYFASLLVESEEKILTQDSNLILTSDGIHDYMEEEALEEELSAGGDVYEMCKRIVRKARENGSTDDISLIIVDRMGKYVPKQAKEEIMPVEDALAVEADGEPMAEVVDDLTDEVLEEPVAEAAEVVDDLTDEVLEEPMAEAVDDLTVELLAEPMIDWMETVADSAEVTEMSVDSADDANLI